MQDTHRNIPMIQEYVQEYMPDTDRSTSTILTGVCAAYSQKHAHDTGVCTGVHAGYSQEHAHDTRVCTGVCAAYSQKHAHDTGVCTGVHAGYSLKHAHDTYRGTCSILTGACRRC